MGIGGRRLKPRLEGNPGSVWGLAQNSDRFHPRSRNLGLLGNLGRAEMSVNDKLK